MAQVVYMLCALTSLGCTWLFFNRYRRTRTDLLFWSAVAFLALGFANVLLFIDLVIVRNVDFSLLRNLITLGGALVLIHGLIKNSTR